VNHYNPNKGGHPYVSIDHCRNEMFLYLGVEMVLKYFDFEMHANTEVDSN
jgi:hypothetical protein